MNFLRILLIILALFLAGSSFYFTQKVTVDASSDTLILKSDKTFKYYEYYNNIFFFFFFFVIAVKSKKEIDSKYIENIVNLKNKLTLLKDVDSVFTILDTPILFINNLSLSDLANTNIKTIENTDYKLSEILNEFSESPVFGNQIINSSKNLSSIIIYLKSNKKFRELKEEFKNTRKSKINNQNIDNNYKQEKNKIQKNKDKLIKDIRKIILNQKNDYQYFLGGIDMISSDAISYVKSDIALFSVAVLFLIIIILYFIYRDIKWVIIPLITTMYSVLLMTGFMGIMNWEITAISSNFISLMLILSISMNIHIINHYRISYLETDNNNSIFSSLKKMFWPCFYTALTTIVAFGSLLFSNIKPVIDFGNIMVVSLSIILLNSFTILPLIIYYFPKINKTKKIKFTILNNFYQISKNHSKKIIFINILIFFVSSYGIFNLNVENSFINYFKSNTNIYKGMKIIDTELGGTTPIDIIIKFKDEINIENSINEEFTETEDDLDIFDDFNIDDDLFDDNFFDDRKNEKVWFTNQKINTVKKIHKYLESRKETGKVQSLHTLINMANLINKSELSIFELSVLHNEIPQDYKESLIDPYLSIDENMVKITARIKDSENIKRNEFIKDINKFLSTEFENIDYFEVNGLLVLYNNMLQSLFSSQIKSFGIILITIFVMFNILFRSFKLSVISIIPNIIASIFILGLIGLLKIPLDIMTITIAAITIGIAVDNTIHYIYRIQYNTKMKINNNKENIMITHNNVGNAVLTTSITIALGFSVLSLSNFIPTILFGIFTALAMIVAMLGVLITLPALLNKIKI